MADSIDAPQSAGMTTFTYDNNGNTTFKTVPGVGETRYVYNYENKITRIFWPAGRGISNYWYDGDGVRRKKMDPTGTRCFVYDGSSIIAVADVSGNLQVVYTYGVDGLVSSRAAGQSYFYHFDGLGSTRAMTKAQAQLVEVYDYEAFGNQLLAQGGLATAYRYVGQLGYYRHDDVELDLLGARYYPPEFGRFLTRDPLGQAAGLNLYPYAESNVVGVVDPDGLGYCKKVTCTAKEGCKVTCASPWFREEHNMSKGGSVIFMICKEDEVCDWAHKSKACQKGSGYSKGKSFVVWKSWPYEYKCKVATGSVNVKTCPCNPKKKHACEEM